LVALQEVPPDWIAMILDRQGRVVAHNVNPEQSIGRQAPAELKAALVGTPSGWLRARSPEGSLFYEYRYHVSEITGWTLAFGIPSRTMDAVGWQAAGLFATGLFGAIGLAIGLAFGIARRMSSPLISLAAAAEALGRGTPVTLPQGSAVTEIRTLGRVLRESAAAIQEREQRLRLVVESAPNAMMMVDARGRIVLANPQSERLFGYARRELIGQPIEWLVPLQLRDKHSAYRSEFAAKPQARAMGAGRDLYGLRKDGSEVPVEIGLAPVESGSERLVLASIIDITERKLTEQALRDADRQKDEFLAMLSHELRNPLAALTTAAHVLRLRSAHDAASAGAAGVIDRQTQHMVRLVDDLLDIARVRWGKVLLKREPLNLGELVSEVVQSWRFAGRLNCPVTVSAEPAWIDGDRARIEQIFSNLLHNAVKFTPADGSIEVSVHQQGDAAVLRVTDSGRGIPPESLARLFDPFVQGEQTLARSDSGLGLGLALVRRLAEMHEGSVFAESKGAGQGATFTVRLPLSQPPTEPVSVPSTPPITTIVSRRIVVIEDNDDARQMLTAALTLAGHEVSEARNGTAGIAAIAEGRWDIAVIDIGLPDIDGYEVARRIRRTHGGATMILIALSGYGQEGYQARSHEAGFTTYIVKPVTPEKLCEVIRELEMGMGMAPA
jgi:PAS domain S-box-containing protein